MSQSPSVHRGITVIIPTTGRESLWGTIGSLDPQLHEEDSLVVIYDHDENGVGVNPFFESHSHDYSMRYLVRLGGNYGHTNRNRVLDHHVETSHVWTLDDDDIATPGALDAMRAHMDDPWTIFRMHYGSGPANGITLPHSHRIAYGNLGTPMIFAPLTNARFGEHYSGDHDYAVELQELLGEPVWAEETVAIIRPIAVTS
jgi:hypothetical protein